MDENLLLQHKRLEIPRRIQEAKRNKWSGWEDRVKKLEAELAEISAEEATESLEDKLSVEASLLSSTATVISHGGFHVMEMQQQSGVILPKE